MLSGQLSSCLSGLPDDWILDLDLDDFADGTGALGRVLLIPEAGNRFWLILCDGIPQSIIYIVDNEVTEFTVAYDRDRTDHAVSLVCLGDQSGTADFEPADQQLLFEEDKGKTIRIDFDTLVEVFDIYNDAGQLANPANLAGLTRFANCMPVAGNALAARLDLTIETTGGDHTVTLSMNGHEMASGTITGDGTVNLVEANDSGLSLDLDLTYSGDLALADEAYIEFRWAKSYELHVQKPALAFPRSADGTVADPGLGRRIHGFVADLAAGTYEYLVRAVSDTSQTGTNVAAEGSIAVPGRPEPPASIVYKQGANEAAHLDGATIITVGRSPDDDGGGSVSYRLYDAEAADWAINFVDIADTKPSSGTATFDWTLPDFDADCLRRLSVVAVLGGIEDGRRRRLKIEYGPGGDVVEPRPNVPGFRVKSRVGRTVTVEATYNPAGQEGIATHVGLFVLGENDAIPADGATPDAEVALDALADADIVQQKDVSFAVASDGLFKVLVRASVGSGGVQSENVTPSEAVALSSAVPGTPSNVEARILA